MTITRRELVAGAAAAAAVLNAVPVDATPGLISDGAMPTLHPRVVFKRHETVLVYAPDGRRVLGDSGLPIGGHRFRLDGAEYHWEQVCVCVHDGTDAPPYRPIPYEAIPGSEGAVVILGAMAVTLEPETIARLTLTPPPTWCAGVDLPPRPPQPFGRVTA